MRHLSIRLCTLVLFTLFMAGDAFANQQGYGVPAIHAYPTVRPVSRTGKVTGEGCVSDRDCIVGCTANDPDNLKCLNIDEASNACVDPSGAPTADYPCICLTDVKRCGFSFPVAQTEEITVTTQHTVTTETPHAKKRTAKKPSAKKKSKKKAVKKTATKAPSASGAAAMAAPATTTTTTTTTTVQQPAPLPAPAPITTEHQ